jgi:uncharacterized membrane protein HdeD (DUF308 family)
MTTTARTNVIRVAGVLILLLAFAAALLPLAQHIPGRTVVGVMLIAAGAIEMAAVVARRGHHLTAGAAAAASLVAGLRLELDSGVNFLTVLNFVILWLVVRAAALFFSARHSPKPLCSWVYFAAAVDFALGVLLLIGLPIALLVYGIFGTTNDIIATFAWVLAISFVAAGWLLIAAAPLEASETD